MTSATGTLLGLLVVAACTSGSQDAGGSPQDDGDALMTLFSQIPDEPETRASVEFAVPGRLAQQLDVAVPAPDADFEQILDYSAALTGYTRTSVQEGEQAPGSDWTESAQVPVPTWTVCRELGSNRSEDVLRPELGFSLSQVHGVIEAGTAPETHCAMTGDFDPGGIDEVVRAEPAFSGLREVAEFEGVDYHRWGEDFAGVTRGEPYTQTPVRRLGRGGRMHADAGRIYWGWADAMVEGMIAAGVTGSRASLADDEGIRSIVEHFDDHGVFGGFLSDEVGTGLEAVCPSYCDEAALAEWSERFTFADGIELWAGGWGQAPDGEHVGFVAVVSSDATDTEANLASIEANIREARSNITGQPWSEVFAVVDTVAEGRLGVVQLTYGSATDHERHLGVEIRNVLYRREALFVNRE